MKKRYLLFLLPLLILQVGLLLFKRKIEATALPQKKSFTLYQPLPSPQKGEWLFEHYERGQTVAQFVASKPNIPTTEKGVIYIQLIEDIDTTLQRRLQIFTQTYFTLPVKVLPSTTIETTQFSSRINGEEQYFAPDILDHLEKNIPTDAYAIIALTTTDLYHREDWNFIFGLATFIDRVGVFSLNRYQTTDRRLFLKRACKIINHELGHQFGMAHCTEYHCTMNGANHLEEMDSQPLHLCPSCHQKLQSSVHFDSVKRYQKLHTLYRDFQFINETGWTLRWLQKNKNSL